MKKPKYLIVTNVFDSKYGPQVNIESIYLDSSLEVDRYLRTLVQDYKTTGLYVEVCVNEFNDEKWTYQNYNRFELNK